MVLNCFGFQLGECNLHQVQNRVHKVVSSQKRYGLEYLNVKKELMFNVWLISLYLGKKLDDKANAEVNFSAIPPLHHF